MLVNGRATCVAWVVAITLSLLALLLWPSTISKLDGEIMCPRPGTQAVDAGVCMDVPSSSTTLSSQSPAVRCFPSFVIVGAMKAGTGVLMHLLNQHPALVSGKGEDGSNEIHFFRSPRHTEFPGKPRRGGCSADWWAYLQRFPVFRGTHAAGRRKTFDKSPDYMRSKLSIWQLHAMLPSAKLIVLLRNPASRAISEFNHNCRHGRYFRIARNGSSIIMHANDVHRPSSAPLVRYPCSLEDFRQYYFSSSGKREIQLSSHARKEASHGYYAQQIQWILDRFDARQVLVLFQEKMQVSTLETCRQVERFVGAASFRYTGVDKMHVSHSTIALGNDELYRQTRADLERLYLGHNLQLQRLLVDNFNLTLLPWYIKKYTT